MEDEQDVRMRKAAFEQVRRLNLMHDVLTSQHLAAGFTFEGKRIPLVNPQRGIFKPRQMRYLLSIRTVFPKPGGKIWYDDQRDVHHQIYDSVELVEYAFMGADPDAADNRWLREAWMEHVPIVYFIGVAPGRFLAQVPAFVAGWDRTALKAAIGLAQPWTTRARRLRMLRRRGATHWLPSSNACTRARSVRRSSPRMAGAVPSLDCRKPP